MSALLALLSCLTAAPSAAAGLDPLVEAAIVQAVRARIGATADVTVVAVDAAAAAPHAIEDALLEPGASLGRLVRVVLRAAMERGGSTVLTPVARVTVRLEATVDHWHTTRPLARGATLSPGDIERVRHRLTTGALVPPPSDAHLIGAAVLYDVPADACLTGRSVRPQAAVKAGETVMAVVRIGTVEARAALVAIDAGRIGGTVRVRHPETKRTMSATVVARGEVEVQP